MNPDRQLVFLDRLKDMRQLAGGEWFPPQFIENQLRASPFVRDAMVIGDERHAFVSALVNINAGIAGRFAERRGLAYGTFTELSQLPEIRAEVARADRRRQPQPRSRPPASAASPPCPRNSTPTTAS